MPEKVNTKEPLPPVKLFGRVDRDTVARLKMEALKAGINLGDLVVGAVREKYPDCFPKQRG